MLHTIEFSMGTRASALFMVVNWFSTGMVIVRVGFAYAEAGWLPHSGASIAGRLGSNGPVTSRLQK